MSKGSRRRPRLVSREVEELRWQLAYGKISRATYDRKIKDLRKERKE